MFGKEFYCTKVSFSSSLYPFPSQLRQHLQPLAEVLHVSPTIIRWFTAELVGSWSLLTFPAPRNLKYDTDPLSNLINGSLRWKYRRDKERNMQQEGMLAEWVLTALI